jgi:hypothetical protein
VPAHWTRLLALLFLFVASPASAANEWWIGQSSGTVWILEEGRPPRLASPGTIFPNAATLATAPSARALLVHGAESVLVGPSTVIALVQRGGRTRVVQVSGVAEFEVERQNVQHFSVETRYFAAVVKGTHFTVRVDDDGARVGVERGVVEVTAPESGQRTDLTAGMEAVVTADNPAIGIFGGRPVVLQIAPPRIPAVPPPAVADEAAPTILAAQTEDEDVEDEEESDEESEDEADEDSSGPTVPDDSGGLPGGGDEPGPGEDHDSGHGNDDDHEDGDNSGHGHDHDHDGECDDDS